MKEIVTSSVEQTESIGYMLGSILKGGELVCLSGNLGTGKTAFTKGLAKALGIDENVTSPTFTIVNEYRGRFELFHFDVYRIADPDEMFEIGLDEYLSSGGVVVIEWAELIADVLPSEKIEVLFARDLSMGTEVRRISIAFAGKKYEGYENDFAGKLEG